MPSTAHVKSLCPGCQSVNTGPGTLRINTIISNVSCALPDDCLVVPSTGEVLADNVTMEVSAPAAHAVHVCTTHDRQPPRWRGAGAV